MRNSLSLQYNVEDMGDYREHEWVRCFDLTIIRDTEEEIEKIADFVFDFFKKDNLTFALCPTIDYYENEKKWLYGDILSLETVMDEYLLDSVEEAKQEVKETWKRCKKALKKSKLI